MNRRYHLCKVMVKLRYYLHNVAVLSTGRKVKVLPTGRKVKVLTVSKGGYYMG